ncbi:unnamed protein product [Zymoseptoria tritici ST99CH_1A5]|uniref:Protein DOM34 homolog n=3 Tax=Zymoseptoria tritici TaxID=1047171 RepID=A0A1X7RC51_ZYMT9|nr:unnamed protein product [Zymoseptoria tritici ST99CH_3D7]SMR41358.1 unnamed protein product [Zymoseptoria tritici ST99CH_1E4]SMR43560.1 unnamed protein product [Zymoseptoria tritici ST99CH_3D1]SMY18705.1 unnamed protein product [Zymoseptoria tritici ST99CH_1A5]
MRLIRQAIVQKDGSGSATLLPEEPEDMWHAYNLIRADDLLTASAVRKVFTDAAGSKTSDSATSRANKRIHMILTIRVTKLDFDPQAGQLHVSGQIVSENEHVSLGSHHTLDLELHRNFTLEKADGWDSIAIATLKESVNQDAKAQLWAVVMQEGMANICLVTEYQTILRQRVEMPIPKKRAGSSEHDKRLDKFYQTVFDSLLRQINLEDPKPLLLASPGFTASTFQQFIKKQAAGGSNKPLSLLVSKITVAHSASGHTHSLAEVLSSPAVTSQLSDSKFARATQVMDRFSEMIRNDDLRAWYGPKEVSKAIERGAVGKGGGVLMISNGLFRSQEIKTRKRWITVVDEVKEQGGEVIVLSSMHESGKRLEGLGGVAAILTWPIEDLDDDMGNVEGGEDLPDDDDGPAHGIEGRNNDEGFDLDGFM